MKLAKFCLQERVQRTCNSGTALQCAMMTTSSPFFNSLSATGITSFSLRDINMARRESLCVVFTCFFSGSPIYSVLKKLGLLNPDCPLGGMHQTPSLLSPSLSRERRTRSSSDKGRLGVAWVLMDNLDLIRLAIQAYPYKVTIESL